MTIKELKEQLGKFSDDVEIKYAPQGNIYYPVNIILTPASKRYGEKYVFMNCLVKSNNK